MKLQNSTTLTAEDLFRLTDDGAGGWLQTAKRRLKFHLRHRLCRVHLQEIQSFFVRNKLEVLSLIHI
jgi:hypothetical protein